MASEANRERFATFYRDTLSQADRDFLAKLMSEYSLSCQKGISADSKFGARSPLTCAYVEVFMLDCQLEFVWRAFFDESQAADNNTLLDTYNRLKSALPKASFSKLLMITVIDDPDDAPKGSRSVMRNEAATILMPGDQVMVRPGGINSGREPHYAILFAVAPRSEWALLLDPFPEPWDPKHNSLISESNLVEYKYHRNLVRVKLKELVQELIAVFAIRDL